MMVFFASFNTPELLFLPRLDDVFDLYTKMVLGMKDGRILRKD